MRVFLDTPSTEDLRQFVLCTEWDDIAIIINLLETKYPDQRGHWDHSEKVPAVIISTKKCKNFCYDLELLGFDIVNTHKKFDFFREMMCYVNSHYLTNIAYKEGV
jgi:hypothetical protein